VAHMTQLPSFTRAEQSRLASYKAAVGAGFYSDTLPDPSLAYPFKREERARLVVYKAPIAAGFYTDQIGEEDREG
jgi:hypothetical protein